MRVFMKASKYDLHRLFLFFIDPGVEDRYRKFTLERTTKFTRITWFIVILLTVVFSVLDSHFFC